MAMRLNGLMSGMDTESIVSQLVEVKKVKVETKKKEQTKLEWKQEAWKDLNKKLKNLQSKYINNMRFSTAYAKKTTKVSNSSAVSVITGDGAVDGVQSLKVSSLAKTGYLTGGKIIAHDEEGVQRDATALARMSDLGFSGTGSFKLNIGGQEKATIDVNENTTISDVINKLKENGLNASFDVSNQRLFISAKSTGEAADFELVAADADGQDALAKLGLQTNDYYKSLAYNLDSNGNITTQKTIDDYASDIAATVASRVKTYAERYGQLMELSDQYTKLRDKAISYGVDFENAADEATAISDKLTELQEALEAEKAKGTDNENEEDNQDEDKIQELETQISDLQSLKSLSASKESRDAEIAEIKTYVDVTAVGDPDAEGKYDVSGVTAKAGENGEDGKLLKEVKEEYAARLKEAREFVESDTASATKIKGSDAVIYLNDAKFTSTSNTFNINGLTITANAANPNEEITLTTERDTDGIYDMIKSFLKEYNEVINEIDKLYNAASAKDFEPLTDEEKETMSESEIEKYEQKIKDALLRRDENLNTIGSSLREVMASGFSVGGKTMYLFDFGISTLGYFNAAENEKNAYHIDGDADDENTSGNTDKLKAMIASDPDSVINFFSSLSKGLYDKMTNLSASSNGYRSFGTFYDDKKMKTDYDDYTTKIKELEEKMNAYEDKWYKKFSKMETAMAKMQKNTSAISAMLGGGNS